jgi:hypothetical protein
LFIWNEVTEIPEGQYSIPFSFKLPNHLPATFHHQKHGLLAAIVYQLEVNLPQNGTKEYLKYKTRIFIKEHNPHSQHDPVNNIKVHNEYLKSYICCNVGCVKFSLNFEKPSYSPDEVCKSHISIDNSLSSLNIGKVTVTLKQRIDIKPKEESHARIYVIAKEEVPPIAKGTKLENIEIKFVLPRVEKGDIWVVGDSERFNLIKSIPERDTNDPLETITNTTKGDIIQSKFFVEIEINFVSTISPPRVLTTEDLEIHANDVIPPPPIVEKRLDWDAQSYPEASLMDNRQYFVKGKQELNQFSVMNENMNLIINPEQMPMIQLMAPMMIESDPPKAL